MTRMCTSRSHPNLSHGPRLNRRVLLPVGGLELVVRGDRLNVVDHLADVVKDGLQVRRPGRGLGADRHSRPPTAGSRTADNSGLA